jgi:hypothetical protein
VKFGRIENQLKKSLVVGFFPDTFWRRLIAAVNLHIGIMRDAAFFPMLSDLLADK